MAINFCMPHHMPSVTCNKVSTDGFEVDNLISSDQILRNRGFQAEYFIKPPVEIVVSFFYPVDISHILLGLKKGSQQTSSIALLAESRKYENESANTEDFHLISKEDNLTASKLCFKNRRYRSRGPFRSFSPFKPFDAEIRDLRPKWFTNVSSVGKLKICLLRTAGSSIPVLSLLEVWGQPCTSCGSELIWSIFQTEWDIRNPPINSAGNISESSVLTETDKLDEDVGNEIDVPSEFIDSITCEIMSLPMILPCGKIVDNATLEKYNQTQSSWGHSAGDPFTGLPFHQGNQPVLNTALKARIDQFLVQHGSNLCVPRTVGRCKTGITDNNSNLRCADKNVHLISHSFLPETVTHSLTLSSSSHYTYNDAPCCLTQDNRLPEKKTAKRSSSWTCTKVKKCKTVVQNLTISGKSEEENAYNCPLTGNKQLKSVMTHKDQLAKSLNFALKNALKNMKSFTKVEPSSFPSNNCTVCSMQFACSMFQLPCSHILCRSCLVSKTDKGFQQCSNCRSPFKSSDAVRVYL